MSKSEEWTNTVQRVVKQLIEEGYESSREVDIEAYMILWNKAERIAKAVLNEHQ